MDERNRLTDQFFISLCSCLDVPAGALSHVARADDFTVSREFVEVETAKGFDAPHCRSPKVGF